jgi:class 3 adenylate cyclase
VDESLTEGELAERAGVTSEFVRRLGDLGIIVSAEGGEHYPASDAHGDYYGRTVNVAARIAGRAGPNEVLVSEEVAELSGDSGRIRFDDLGPAELKNVSRPIRLFRASRVSGAAAPDQST